MAKYFGSIVKRGKVGGSVFRVRNGVTIESQYQPYVFNPSTVAQVQARAKLKLMSQLSEVFSPMIAFRREGLVSPRNLFVKANYSKATFADTTATFPVEDLDLTGGILAVRSISLTRGENGIEGRISVGNDISRVVYALFINRDDELILYKTGSAVPVNDAVVISEQGVFSVAMYLVAYGIRDNTEAARVAFGNIAVPSLSVDAILTVMRTLTRADISLTETAVAKMNAV